MPGKENSKTFSLITIEAADDDISPSTVIVKMNRLKKRNALSTNMKRELIAIANELSDRTDIQCIILTGAGNFFSAGNDISERNSFAQNLPLAEARRFIRLGLEMCNTWESLPQMTIAAIDQFAIGGGLSLALACDFRVLHTNGWVRAPEVELGITYSWGTLPRLSRLVGPARAKLISGLCRKIDAETAYRWGLCEEVSDDTLKKALEIASEITSKPQVAQQMVKESINRLNGTIDTGAVEQDLVLLNMQDPEAIKAQKRLLKKL